MGAISVARAADKAHGPTLDLYRGFVPRALLLHWAAKETGWDRLAVSVDKRIIEVGLPQAPLARAWKTGKDGVDPFNVYGACYLMGREALDDADYWIAAGTDDPERRRIARWLPKRDRNLWYACEMDYSIGTGGCRKVFGSAVAWAEASGRGPYDRGLMAEVLDWADRTDLDALAVRGYFGRQSGSKVKSRIDKHAEWVRDAAEVGPIDDAPEGGYPTEEPPRDKVPPFPPELKPAAMVVNQRDAGDDDCLRSWQAVRAYAKARRRREYMPRERMVSRAKSWIAESRPVDEPRVLIERDWGNRVTVPW